MLEEWRDIQGYEGLYQISNFGEVKSIKRQTFMKEKTGKEYFHTTPERILKQTVNHKGYKVLNLNKDGKKKFFQVHRLVATHFIGDPKDLTVDHIDSNKQNNRADNLQYVTRYQNSVYAQPAYTIIVRDKQNNFINVFKNERQCSDNIGLSQQFINEVLRGKLPSREYNLERFNK